ncbi:hypothetical protein AMTRI_Chr05g74300 [Amborella trichopoda]
MAMTPLVSRNLVRRGLSLSERGYGAINGEERQLMGGGIRRFTKSTADNPKDVAVTERSRPLCNRRRRGSWRSGRDLAPFGFNDVFAPISFGSTMELALENLNSLFGNLTLSRATDDFVMPFSATDELIGGFTPSYQITEDDKAYKLRFEMPGLSKEDIKVTIEDGHLVIKGEHKEEEGDDTKKYGYYNTSLLLPQDAKLDEIKAEMKHGVLQLTVPKTETSAKDVKEVKIE